MNRNYQTVSQIVSENPGAKMYILMMPTGSTFYYKPDEDEAPTAKVALMGTIP